MRLYHGCPSPKNMRRARVAAPSHVHGACWTPHKMTPHEWPYFIDNGAYTETFDRSEWLDTLDAVDEKMPHRPEFVVLPMRTTTRRRPFSATGSTLTTYSAVA